MHKIKIIVAEYKNHISNFNQESLNDISNLRQLITLSSEYLHLLRLSVRGSGFKSEADEIAFFKNSKPFVSGHLKYYSHVHAYLINYPKINTSKQRKYIQHILDKFEVYKLRELDFVKYYRHKATKCDHIYFIRGLNNIAITKNINSFIDPEFSSSHDDMVAKIVAYDLLVSFYKNELQVLKNKKNTTNNTNPLTVTENYLWTASKTDLVELIYAVNAIGAIQNGNMDLKSIAKLCETVFSIDLGNFYKTYNEIRAREGVRTRFLENMRHSLIKKMDNETT